MPPPRKIDLLPPELRGWLDAELKTRGCADYQGLAEALNFRLEEAGLELRVQKSALHAYGADCDNCHHGAGDCPRRSGWPVLLRVAPVHSRQQ